MYQAYQTKYPALRALVRERVLRANSPELCNEAEELLVEWLAAEPDDYQMRTYGSGLQRMKDALRLIADGRGDETDPAKLALP